MSKPKYDFSGYGTKYNIKCTDGRTIRNNAFKHQDGSTVPLVWAHQRNDPDNVIGKVLLEHHDEGVYCYASFNNTSKAQTSKALVEHGDITHLSIFANQLMEKSKNVMHGEIREVSLVLAGANPGALIDDVVVVHSDGSMETADGEAIIYTDDEIEMSALDDSEDGNSDPDEEDSPESMEHKDDNPSAEEVLKSMNEDQKTLFYAAIAHTMKEMKEMSKDSEDGAEDDESKKDGGKEMKQSVFEGKKETGPSLSHDAIGEIFENARKYECNSFGKYLAQACLEHGITDIDYLFDEEQLVRQRPDLIARDQAWVAKVYDAASKSPFSRIKSMAANLTADEARAKGYIKGKKKVDEQFSLLKRSTTPQTIYKKQSFERDDIADINSFDVIAWIKAEMKMMLREEAARAQLVGDGRNASSDDKISETNIRPIFGDSATYVIYQEVVLPTDGNYTDTANAIIDAANISRKNYKGSGSPNMFTSSDIMSDLTLAKDKNGRRLYNNASEIASALRVNEVVEVPVLDNVVKDGKKLLSIIVNMRDYTVGATKMGQTTMFEDFDIDYNKQKYLIETRMSGALTLPYSAICLYATVTPPTPPAPSEDGDDSDDESAKG